MFYILSIKIETMWHPVYTSFFIRRSDEHGRCHSWFHRSLRCRVHARSMEELECCLQHDVSRLLHRLPHVHRLRNRTEDCLARLHPTGFCLRTFQWMAAVSLIVYLSIVIIFYYYFIFFIIILSAGLFYLLFLFYRLVVFYLKIFFTWGPSVFLNFWVFLWAQSVCYPSGWDLLWLLFFYLYFYYFLYFELWLWNLSLFSFIIFFISF